MADTIYEEPFLPGDPRLVDNIVRELKSQGIFDQFRKECIADVDTKPAYQNLRQRVEGSVGSFLSRQRWKPTLNKNQLREKLRKHILDSNFLDQGVERIVDQVVNPKVGSVFIPKVEDVVYQYLGFDTANNMNTATTSYSAESSMLVPTDMLPNDLEAVSPDSVKSQEMKDDMFVNKNQSFMDTDFNLNQSIDMNFGKDAKLENTDEEKKSFDDSNEDLESPPFEPLESAIVEEHSQESQLSGISDLTSHDSIESKLSTIKPSSPSWGTKADLESSDKKDVSDDKGMFDSQSHNDDSSSDSHLLREMSPLTPVHNFDENSSDAQPPFTNSSIDIKKEIEMVSDFKTEINFKTVHLTNPPRLSIESKSSPDVGKYSQAPDITSDDSKTSVFAPNQPEVVALEDRFNTQIDLNDYGPTDNDSSNSNNLHIAYDSPKSEQNYEEKIEYGKKKEDMSSIPLPMDLDIPMPDDDDRYKKSSEKTSQGENRKSSSHHKSSRDSDRHSSKHSSSSRHKHSSSSRDGKVSHRSDKRSDAHQLESHRSRSLNKDSHSDKLKEKSDHSKSSSKSKEKGSETSLRSTSTNRESTSKSSSHRSHHSSSSKHRHSSSSSNTHKYGDNHRYSDKTDNSSSDRHKSSKTNGKEKSKSNSKDREKKDEKSSSSKDRHKSSSSHHSEKDRKHSEKDRKHSEKDRKHSEKDRKHLDHKHSSSSKDKYDDKKSDKKDKVKSSDDHYSSSGRAGRTRRSTDRDSNDGNNSSSKTNTPSTSKTSSSEHRRHHTNSKTDNNSVSNDSSTQSDCVENKFKLNQSVCKEKYEVQSEKLSMKPVMRIENQLNTPLSNPPILSEILDLPKVKKPRIASNIHEARKIMKIRKQMDIDEVKKQQEATLQIEIRDNVARNSSRVFSGISGPELEFTCSDRVGVIDLLSNRESYSDEDRDTSDDDFEYEDDVQEDLNYFDQDEIDEAIAKSEQQIQFYNKYSQSAPQTETKVHFLYCDNECEDIFKNALDISETIINLGNNEKDIMLKKEMSPEIEYNLKEISVELERNSNMSKMEEGTVYKISELQSKNIAKKINIESDIMIEINSEEKKVIERNLRARDEFDEQIGADLNNSVFDCSLDSVNSDYYNRIDDIMNNTSRQQIMEIILGGGGDVFSSPTKFAYNYNSSYIDSPKGSPQQTVKRKASTDVFESADEDKESLERTENNNRKVLMTNKVQKVSSTEHISSTTEGENASTVPVTARSSKFIGKARRVGLSKPKDSFATAPKSPSSDRSVENYNQNCLDETRTWMKKSPNKNEPQPRPKPKRRPKQEMQRYDTSDLYKPRPTFLLSRRSNVN